MIAKGTRNSAESAPRTAGPTGTCSSTASPDRSPSTSAAPVAPCSPATTSPTPISMPSRRPTARNRRAALAGVRPPDPGRTRPRRTAGHDREPGAREGRVFQGAGRRALDVAPRWPLVDRASTQLTRSVLTDEERAVLPPIVDVADTAPVTGPPDIAALPAADASRSSADHAGPVPVAPSTGGSKSTNASTRISSRAYRRRRRSSRLGASTTKTTAHTPVWAASPRTSSQARPRKDHNQNGFWV